MSSSLSISLAIGAIFAPLGGLMAGVITYIEYQKHPLSRARVLGEAVRSGIFATIVLIALTAAFGWSMGRM